jgi:hypothetical protein
MLSTNSRSFRWLLVVAFALALVDVHADDKPAQKMSGWQRLFRQHAAAYKVAVEGDGGSEAKLVPEPVLQWSQPVRGGADGAVFVWALEGRPVVIGTLFIWPMADGRQGVTHELHSLSQSPLVAIWRDRRWTPPEDSIVWNAIPDAPVPAATPERRLRQMRDLARQFSAESHDKSDRRWDLRPLSSPIYRYGYDPKDESSPADGEIVDGALFGFVEGTDLEVVLSIQARYTVGSYRWEYAFSRMSDFRLIAKHSDKSVWEVDRANFDNPRVAYYCSTVESRTSPDDE